MKLRKEAEEEIIIFNIDSYEIKMYKKLTQLHLKGYVLPARDQGM